MGDRLLLGLLLILALVNAGLLAFVVPQREALIRVSFLDVGQGDSIFIEAPGGDMLIDGGKDRSAIRELPRLLGPLDRTLDLVIATHPDADHVGGLPEIFSLYAVGALMESGVEHQTSYTKALEAAANAETGLERIEAHRGMRIHLGNGAYADVLYPDRDVSTVESNMGSVILRLVYGKTEFMLTGDAPETIENWIASRDGEALRSDVLKAGHHGSKTSTGQKFLDAVSPKLVVISAGEDNSYGHPHPDVLGRVQAAGAALASTAESGTLTYVSDGENIRRR